MMFKQKGAAKSLDVHTCIWFERLKVTEEKDGQSIAKKITKI